VERFNIKRYFTCYIALVIYWITCCFSKYIMGLKINSVVHFRNLISNFIMSLQPSKSLAAYSIPQNIRKQSWAKKRKKKKGVKGVLEDISEIYKK